MEFKKLARLKVIAAFARSGSMILFALAGLGPLSFALPLIVYALCQTIIGYILVRDTLWTRRPRFRMWPAIFARTKWLLIAAMALAAFSQGDYLVLGFTVTAETLGLYFFAFQLALQIHQLLGHNLGMVLFPALTRLQDQPARLRNATLRAIRMLACIGAAASAALAAVAEPLEALVWRGNWHAAVPAIQIMGLLFVFRLLLPILQSLLWSRGQFAKLAGLGTGLAAGLMTATAVAGLAFPTPAGIALTVCAFFAVGVTAALAIAVKPIGITPKQLVSAIVIPWLPAAAAAALALATDRFLLTPATESLPQPGAAAARVAALAALYAATLAVTVRLAMPGTTAELLNLCPAKLRPTMRTIARINPPNRNAT
jgi:O-antigen/teichoic acid export membrane protein